MKVEPAHVHVHLGQRASLGFCMQGAQESVEVALHHEVGRSAQGDFHALAAHIGLSAEVHLASVIVRPDVAPWMQTCAARLANASARPFH